MAAGLFIVVLGLSLIFLPLYLIPAMIAFARRPPHRHAITLVNVTMGFSSVAWVVALVWAFTAIQAGD